MSRIAFVIRTDCHIADNPPRARLDNYRATCMDKLRQIGDLARQVKATAVIDNGDFFHYKSPSKNSHGLIQEVMEVHAAYPCPVYENPGNHDFPYANLETLDQQPLGVLFKAGVFREMKDVTFTDGDLKVRLIGLPYKVIFTPEDFNIQRGDEDYLIVAAHTFASPNGGEAFGREVALSYQDLSQESPDAFIFGHWHRDQGIQHVGGKPFYNLGSMTRGSLTNEEIKRTPRVGSLVIEKINGELRVTCEAHPLKVQDAADIFDLKERERAKMEEVHMDVYLDDLAQAFQADADIPDVRLWIHNASDLSEAVRQKALYYLEQIKKE